VSKNHEKDTISRDVGWDACRISETNARAKEPEQQELEGETGTVRARSEQCSAKRLWNERCEIQRACKRMGKSEGSVQEWRGPLISAPREEREKRIARERVNIERS
jgi:hypothetical protein